ncbi:MAG TPA: amidohydrolase family protein [Candidatus Binatia bacterium]|nr:amidohydrolase family protein [Candidatus Binatia bacterium]
MTVIDVHAHLVPQDVVDILASRGRDFGIALIESEPGCHCCRFESGMQVRPFFESLMNTDQRLSEMDRQGIDREVLSLWTDIFGYDLPAVKGGLWHAALNDSLAQLCNEQETRFSWLASGALQNPAGAARELERCMNAGAVGAIVAAHVAGKNLGECPLDEYWAACVELGAPVFIHPAQPVAAPRAERFALNQIVAYTNDTTLTVGSLIFAGVMSRFPGLQFILAHGGGSVPYLIGRFDRMHRAANPKVTGNVAEHAPSGYLTRFYYDTILHHSLTLRYLRELVGIERMLLGTDLPFPPGDPDPLSTLRHAEFNAADIERIVHTNPSALFRF